MWTEGGIAAVARRQSKRNTFFRLRMWEGPRGCGAASGALLLSAAVASQINVNVAYVVPPYVVSRRLLQEESRHYDIESDLEKLLGSLEPTWLYFISFSLPRFFSDGRSFNPAVKRRSSPTAEGNCHRSASRLSFATPFFI